MMTRNIKRVFVFVFIIAVGVSACTRVMEKQEDGVYGSGFYSPQYHEGKFRNDAQWQDHTISESLPLIWEYFFWRGRKDS